MKSTATAKIGQITRPQSDGAKGFLAVFLLLLFCSSCGSGSGPSGSAPDPAPDPAPGVAQPFRTGQTASYAVNDDGALQKGVAWPSPRFTDNNDGTVTDGLTGLIWLKQANAFAAMTWYDALAAANTLASGACGLSDGSRPGDWRVPNVNELSSLVSIADQNPAVPDNPFASLQSSYWSSTTLAETTYNAWMVYLGAGYVDNVGKKSLLCLLPVRGGTGARTVNLPKTGQKISYAAGDDGAMQKGVAPPSPRFVDNGDGTVTDNLTGLVWLKNANCLDETIAGAYMMKQLGLMMWPNALAWTNALASGSCGLTDASQPGDWRVPNRNELAGLIDYSQANPAVPAPNPFDNVKPGAYWSSSSFYTLDGAPQFPLAWYVDFSPGLVNVDDAKLVSADYVWPVRDAVAR